MICTKEEQKIRKHNNDKECNIKENNKNINNKTTKEITITFK